MRWRDRRARLWHRMGVARFCYAFNRAGGNSRSRSLMAALRFIATGDSGHHPYRIGQ